jgi:acyl-CoA thioester hydrolase
MLEHAITYRGAVYPWHCDHMGHMNVSWYVGKFDEAHWNLAAELGVTPTYMRTRGRLMVAVDQRIAYRREVMAGSVVLVESATLGLRNSSIRFLHRMRNAETRELVALTVLTGVHLDAATRRSCPLPDDIRDAVQSALVDDPDRWSAWPLPSSLLE